MHTYIEIYIYIGRDGHMQICICILHLYATEEAWAAAPQQQ